MEGSWAKLNDYQLVGSLELLISTYHALPQGSAVNEAEFYAYSILKNMDKVRFTFHSHELYAVLSSICCCGG